MTVTWVVVASAVRTKIFSVNKIKFLNGKEKLKLLRELLHPESRLHDSEIVSDKMGHYEARNHAARGSFSEPTDPKQHEMDVFAREIAHYLEGAKVDKTFQELILVAAPGFYGLLNKHMPASLKKAITLVIEKDYVKESDSNLEKHLKQQIG